jgi:phosphopantothenoylcysteine decarboxylase/phosphopantothenate--cysteine ligase
MSLAGKKILLGVCGGISAYKCAHLTRSLIKEGAEVKIIMTPDAKAFIGVLTFSTLSKNPVAVDFYNANDGTWNNHVSAGLWPDLFLIAPATANTIAKMASGIADNFLLATYLSARCKVMLAPAMDLDMWKHPATQNNIDTLTKNGNIILQPESGELASGLHGEGRMPEPENIVNQLHKFFSTAVRPLAGKKVLITAGPTYEAIDPVRFIGNYSSGKMGFALAECLADAGAEVTLVHGPVQVTTNEVSIKKIAVTNAEQMLNACAREFPLSDIFISAAAVADFTPKDPAAEKIKKTAENKNGMVLHLKRTVDILKEMALIKDPKQLVVGFALETNNGLVNAEKKLNEKQLDMIILNTLEDAGAGFQHDSNKISILDKNKNLINFELKSKKEVAQDIVNQIIKMTHA